LNEGLSVLSPFGLVKVDGEKISPGAKFRVSAEGVWPMDGSNKIAGIVRQERVDANCLLAGKVAVDDRIRFGYQRTIAAIGTGESRLRTQLSLFR